MRGYFAFVLVFVSVVLLLNMLESSYLPHPDYSKEVAIGKNYQLQLNAKEAALEAARQGARDGFEEYALAHPGSEFDLGEAREAARKKAFEYVSLLAGWEFDPDFEVVLWCGYADAKEVSGLKKRMLDNGRAEICGGCARIDSAECGDFVNVELGGDGALSSVWLGANSPESIFEQGVVGVSAYSEKFGVAGASYIPQSVKKAVG